MKKIFIGIVLLSSFTTIAQSRWGIKTGLNYNLTTIGLSDAANSAQQILEGETADNGYHLGVFGRQFLGDQLYTSGSLIFAKNTHFLEGYDDANNLVYGQFNHEFLQLDADLGIRLLKLVRAEAGVHYQATISDNTFNQTFQSPSAGYNVGVGLDLWKLSLDVTYYSSFQDHTGNWNAIPLSYNRSQLLVSLGVKL
jgi:hypothetical protein